MIITQDRVHKKMINYINSTSQFHQIEQNPQNGFNTSPRIFNFSQNPKLIKLTNIDHEYIIVGKKKSLIKFIKQGLINKKSQIKHSSKITQKP